MPTRPLPENASFENLRKQAKRLLQDARAGDAGARATVRDLHPRGEAALAAFALHDAQLVTARLYRFPSWARLKRHLDAVARLSWDPGASAAADEASAPLLDRFLRDACVRYDDTWRTANAAGARELLAAQPALGRADLYTAAAVGEVETVRSLLASEPGLARRRGGVFGWEPLLYACYSRLASPDPTHSTLEVARLLLAAGADPDAGFLHCGLVPPFTALTGAFGNGEGGTQQPPHPQAQELARLLLDAGADPNDGQTLYNRHFRRGDDHLKLLLSYGLGRDRGGPWYRLLRDRLDSPERLLVEELWSAARLGYFERVKLLVEHGTDVNVAGRRDGRTPYEAAVRAGHAEIAAYLRDHGAAAVELSPRDAFAAACIGGRREEALALLAGDPLLLEGLGLHGRVELLHRAVEGRRPEGIRLMAELGFEISRPTRHDGVGINLAATPLHNAAWIGDLPMVELLVGLGADPTIRDPSHHATPLDWAAYNGQQNVVEYLRSLTGTAE
jgi:ankyrin repeat protein